MVSHWDSSLLYNPNLRVSPYIDWLNYTTKAEDYIILATTLSGVPKLWLEWVEKEVINSVKRGINIKNPLSYRMSVLWNGIILLQETKFICDILENAFRQGIYSHTSRFGIKYGEIEKLIPEKNSLEEKYRKEEKDSIVFDSPIKASFLTYFTFYQLTETIVRNWKIIYTTKIQYEGFSKLFWTDIKCRDKNLVLWYFAG